MNSHSHAYSPLSGLSHIPNRSATRTRTYFHTDFPYYFSSHADGEQVLPKVIKSPRKFSNSERTEDVGVGLAEERERRIYRRINLTPCWLDTAIPRFYASKLYSRTTSYRARETFLEYLGIDNSRLFDSSGYRFYRSSWES